MTFSVTSSFEYYIFFHLKAYSWIDCEYHGYFLIALGGLLSLADRGLRVAAPKASGDIAKAAS